MKTALFLACLLALGAAAHGKAGSAAGDFAPDQWTISAAYDNPLEAGERKGLDIDFLKGEEKTLSLKGTKAKGRVVDLGAMFPVSDNKVAYAIGTVRSDKAETMTALFGSDDGAKVWVNGVLVHRVKASRAMVPDEDKFTVHLKKGENVFLVKVENGGGGWSFSLSIPSPAELKRREEAAFARDIAMWDITAGQHSGYGRVLGGPAFPKLTYKSSLAVERFLGTPELKTKWFYQDSTEVDSAQKPGLYFAWVEGLSRAGLPINRILAFYLPSPETAPYLDQNWSSLLFNPTAIAPAPHLQAGWDIARKNFTAVLGNEAPDAFFHSNSAAFFFASLEGLKPLDSSPQGWSETQGRFFISVKLKALGIAPKGIAEPQKTASAPILKAGSDAEAGMKPGTAEKVKAILAKWSQEEGKPFSAVIARHGVVFVHEGFGVDKDAVFYPASIGKTIFGLVFAQFVDQGLAQADQPIGDFLKGFPTKGPKTLTFRHLLTHTSGIAGHGTYGGWSNPTLDSAYLQWTPTLEPGRVFAYGGDGNNLASKVLELISGRPISELMERQLFSPLQVNINQPDGGWASEASAWDIAKIGQVIANKGSYGSHRFMSEETWRKFIPSKVSTFIPSLSDKNLEWGFAISHMPDPDGPRTEGVLGPNVIGHGSASSSILRIDLDSGLVVVMGRYGIGNEAKYNEGRVALMKALKEGLAEP